MIKTLSKALGWLSGGKWKIIHEASGNNPGSIFMLFSSLQSKGIRCRIRKIGRNDGVSLIYRIVVIEDDVARARAVLTETLRQTGP